MPAAVKRQALHSTAECEAVESNATNVKYRVCVLCFGARSLRFNQMSLRCFVAKTAPSACQGCQLQVLIGQSPIMRQKMSRGKTTASEST